MGSAHGDRSLSLQAQTMAHNQTILILFGVMLWEILMTLDFDWKVISGKRRWGVPSILYLLTKHGTLWFFIAVNIPQFMRPDKPLNCQVWQTFLTVTAGVTMAGASSLLMIRALALWRWDRRVAIPLLILHLGQWGLYLHNAMIVDETWGSIGGGQMGCRTEKITSRWFEAQFIYAMAFDFIVLCLASWDLLHMAGRSSLWKVIFIDGWVYFVLAFVSYLGCVIVSYSGAGAWLTFICWDAANVIVTIVSCRSFVRVSTHTYEEYQANLETTTPVSTHFQFARMKPGHDEESGWQSTHVRASVTLAREPDMTPKETTESHQEV